MVYKLYKYFLGVKDEVELSTRYKALAKQLHPDAGGSHSEFVAMKAEYDHIQTVEIYPIANNFFDRLRDATQQAQKSKQESEQALTPQELNNLKAKNYFDAKRFADLTYDVIDDILNKQSTEKLNKLWAYQELQKQYSLELDHFKYMTWKLGDPIALAHSIYKKYQLV